MNNFNITNRLLVNILFLLVLIIFNSADCSKKVVRGSHFRTQVREPRIKRDKLPSHTKRNYVGFWIVRIDEE